MRILKNHKEMRQDIDEKMPHKTQNAQRYQFKLTTWMLYDYNTVVKFVTLIYKSNTYYEKHTLHYRCTTFTFRNP